MSDEGFHEIQLNGKQLVFLFMAATVVSVVIFLCGVMVGRGVRAQQVSAAPSDSVPVETPAPAASAPPGKAEPPQPDEESYQADLTKAEPDKEPKVAPPPAPKEPAATPAAPPRTAEKREEKAPAASTPASVTTGGYVVQIAALRDRVEADAIVKRLAGKGYQAFVVNPVPGKPPVYKVQVGRFTERGEADKIAARLKSEEQFSPWVTR
jgi:cell division septation protein DedD